MNDTIPQLLTYDEAALDRAFAAVAEEVRSGASSLATPDALEAFRRFADTEAADDRDS